MPVLSSSSTKPSSDGMPAVCVGTAVTGVTEVTGSETEAGVGSGVIVAGVSVKSKPSISRLSFGMSVTGVVSNAKSVVSNAKPSSCTDSLTAGVDSTPKSKSPNPKSSSALLVGVTVGVTTGADVVSLNPKSKSANSSLGSMVGVGAGLVAGSAVSSVSKSPKSKSAVEVVYTEGADGVSVLNVKSKSPNLLSSVSGLISACGILTGFGVAIDTSVSKSKPSRAKSSLGAVSGVAGVGVGSEWLQN